MIEFLITYFLLLLFASLFILGWHGITREDMIFQFWSKFWEKKSTTTIKYIDGEKLYKRYREIEKVAIANGYKGTIKYNEEYLEASQDFEAFEKQVEHHLLIHIDVNGRIIKLYEEELIFRFPDWVRNPMSSCPTCMSSVYGSLIYLITIALLKYDIFTWASNRTIAVVLTWIAFEFSLSFVNTFLYKKTNNV